MTPSKRRRAGYKAFEEGFTIDDCPYADTPGWSSSDRNDWIQGWNKALREQEAEERIEALVQEKWQSFADGCPWNSNHCLASRDECTIETCAPWHFRK